MQETQVLSLVGELRTQVLQGNQAHALQLLNLSTTTREPTCSGDHTPQLERRVHSPRKSPHATRKGLMYQQPRPNAAKNFLSGQKRTVSDHTNGYFCWKQRRGELCGWMMVKENLALRIKSHFLKKKKKNSLETKMVNSCWFWKVGMSALLFCELYISISQSKNYNVFKMKELHYQNWWLEFCRMRSKQAKGLWYM